jgi:hypothetical protein
MAMKNNPKLADIDFDDLMKKLVKQFPRNLDDNAYYDYWLAEYLDTIWPGQFDMKSEYFKIDYMLVDHLITSVTKTLIELEMMEEIEGDWITSLNITKKAYKLYKH